MSTSSKPKIPRTVKYDTSIEKKREEELGPPIVEYSRKGDLKGVQDCLNKEGWKCIDWCSKRTKEESHWCRYSDSYDSTIYTIRGDTALFAAIRHGHCEIVQYLSG